MTRVAFIIPLTFQKIEFEFQMIVGYIIWWPVCITSIINPEGGKPALAAAYFTYDYWTDNNDDYYDVDHGSVLFLSQTPLCATIKSEKFNCKSKLHWRFVDAAAITSVQEDNLYKVAFLIGRSTLFLKTEH